MKIQLLSDLHFEFHADGGASFVESLDPSGVDLLVLAGDIATAKGLEKALTLFEARYPLIFYVAGNHEFYQAGREQLQKILKRATSRLKNVYWLDNDMAFSFTERYSVRKRVLGTTLWFPLSDGPKHLMNDFTAIPNLEDWVYDENRKAVEFLSKELQEGDVVVTHHLPSPLCTHPKYAGSSLNCFFMTDLTKLIEERKPALWLHGHTHDSMNLQIGSTRVVCNPFGYLGHELNPKFSSNLKIELR
jgi:predicted phosphodiesterase